MNGRMAKVTRKVVDTLSFHSKRACRKAYRENPEIRRLIQEAYQTAKAARKPKPQKQVAG
jgi:hypothetical protein